MCIQIAVTGTSAIFWNYLSYRFNRFQKHHELDAQLPTKQNKSATTAINTAATTVTIVRLLLKDIIRCG